MDERITLKRHTYSFIELGCTPKPRSQGSHRLQSYLRVESEQTPMGLRAAWLRGRVLVTAVS